MLSLGTFNDFSIISLYFFYLAWTQPPSILPPSGSAFRVFHYFFFLGTIPIARNVTASLLDCGSSRAAGTAVTSVKNKFDTPDNLIVENRLAPGSGADKRAFTYFVLGGARFLYASAARLAVINTIATLSASADVLALAAVEVDLSAVAPGQVITVKWRGKPVFIKHRTEAQIKEVSGPVGDLRHNQTDAERVKDPKWLIVLGVCTHLGCVPIPNAGDYQGWYCPCHGSHYDGSGRIRRGPAPLNLEVPEYKFLDEHKVVLG